MKAVGRLVEMLIDLSIVELDKAINACGSLCLWQCFSSLTLLGTFYHFLQDIMLPGVSARGLGLVLDFLYTGKLGFSLRLLMVIL